MRATPPLIGADLFCGLGGFSEGAELSGHVRVDLAINHWRPAAYCFRANHPHARVICAKIDDVDPRNDRTLPDCDILLASPECTHHSNARGGQPVEDQKRATPWHVCVWAEAKRPKWIVIENVREFRSWGPLVQKRTNGKLLLRKDGQPWMMPDPKRKGDIFRQWIKSLESLGYAVDHQILNAADFGAHTSRQRLFVIARREDVAGGDIPWPEPTHTRDQWRPAHEIIDWSEPAPSIFSRKKPLCEKMLRRIEIGLRKFCDPELVSPFLVKLWGTGTTGSVAEPLGTVTAGGGNFGLVSPFLVKYHGGCDPKRDGTERQHDPRNPLPTVTTANRFDVVTPFILDLAHSKDPKGRSYAVDRPFHTLTTKHTDTLVVPFVIQAQGPGLNDPTYSGVHSCEKPLPTILTRNNHGVIVPFLTKYYGTAGAVPVTKPLDTVTTKGRFGLALVQTMQELGIVDIGFRMLGNQELLRAQGFRADYSLEGARTKAEQTRLIGNAVPPPFSKAICEAIGQATL